MHQLSAVGRRSSFVTDWAGGFASSPGGLLQTCLVDRSPDQLRRSSFGYERGGADRTQGDAGLDALPVFQGDARGDANDCDVHLVARREALVGIGRARGYRRHEELREDLSLTQGVAPRRLRIPRPGARVARSSLRPRLVRPER